MNTRACITVVFFFLLSFPVFSFRPSAASRVCKPDVSCFTGRISSAEKCTIPDCLTFDHMYGEDGTDYVWEMVRDDAEYDASREPLLASFMHATILSHSSLEQALSFHVANQLASPAMIATQIQALMLEIYEKDDSLKDALRKDLIAVVDRDPATKSFTDVILYFKGFQALQAYRISHYLWTYDRQTLALFINSRVNSVYHMDIHPGSKLGIGILLDHGTGIVIGETAIVGNNVSMLHGVTLGGAGKKNVARHPRVGNGETIVCFI